MSLFSRGFHGRPRPDVDPARVPPGQYVETGFPVLSAGPTPRPQLDSWSFSIQGAVGTPVSWTWDEFHALPTETFTKDIHCVTKWTKLDTTWTGVSVDTLLEGVDLGGGLRHDLVRRRLHDQPRDRRHHGRQGLGRRHLRRRAARAPSTAAPRACSSRPVLLEEREVGPRADRDADRRAGLLGAERLPQSRRSLARAALLERLSANPTPLPSVARAPIVWRAATVRRGHRRDAARADDRLRRPRLAWPRGRAARRRAPDGRGRLRRRALVLDRLVARGSAPGADGRADRRRRGLALPDRGAARRAT